MDISPNKTIQMATTTKRRHSTPLATGDAVGPEGGALRAHQASERQEDR
jgi:hypothetical protein